MTDIAISLLGAGRMGTEILRCIAQQSGQFRLAGVWARADSRIHQQDLTELAGSKAGGISPSADLSAAMANADVAIDFTLAEATIEVVAAARASATPLVCGVSGLSPESLQALHEAANDIPVFFARNMSIGIALLERSVTMASKVLGTEFAIEIDDLHHAQKKDAPSGTALLLGEAAARARGQDFASVMHYQPNGAYPPADGSIVYRVRREGEHPGAHEVRFAGAGETLGFMHTVSDRRVFAHGALRAARWLKGRRAGFYGMQDLLADPGQAQTS